MTRWLVEVGHRFGLMALALAVALPLLAVPALRSAPVDVYPEFLPPTVEIQTEALGLSAAEVEHFITLGMEQDLLNGVPWLESIHSTSMPGLSVVDLRFEPGTDLYAARQLVTERMSQARVLPNVGSAPVMIEPLASTSRVAMIGLSAKGVSLNDLSLLARWKLRPRLMGVPGVANVAIYGQRDRQLQITVDPARLRGRNVTLNQVIETAGNSLWVSPLTFVEASTPGTGGFVEGSNQRLAIQHVSPISSPQQLAAVPVTDQPDLRLGDVADVIEDHQPLIGDALVDGRPSLFLVVQKYPGTDTLQVSRNIEQAMAEMGPGLSGVTVTTDVYRPASYLVSALRAAGLAGLLGYLLLVLVLLLLASWRVAATVALTLPLSLLAAVYVLHLGGATLTTITLLGLAAAVGFVIDDGVRSGLAVAGLAADPDADPRQRRGAVIRAGLRPRGPAAYATLVVLLAALPLLVLDRLSTAFTLPLVLTQLLALGASMLVALLLTPALSALLLSRGGSAGRPAAGWAVRAFNLGPARWVTRPLLAWVAVGLLLAAAVAAIPQLDGGRLLPALRDRNLLLEVQAAPGTSLTEMDRISGRISGELRGLPGVLDVGVHVGRAVGSDQRVDANSAELWLSIADSSDYASTRAAIDRVVRGYPGLHSHLTSYADARLDAVGRSGDDLVVRVYGIELDTLAKLAERVRTAITGVPGLEAPVVRPVVQQPTVQIDVDVAKARQHGLKPGDIRRDATTLTSGLIVGNLYEQAKIFDVVVWGGPHTRSDLSQLQNLLLDTPSGKQVRLADVATVRIQPQPTEIRHDEVLRDAEVVARVSGRSPADVARDVQARLATVAMPYEYHAEVLGEATARRTQAYRVAAVTGAALIGILLLLQAACLSWRRSLLVLLLVPLATAGGVLAAALGGGVWSAGALAAIFGALGLAVRGALFLLGRIRELEADDGPSGPAQVLQATRDQAGPLLLSVLGTAALALPAALLGPRAGLELLHPFAITLLGALVSLLLVLLLVLPAALIATTPSRPPDLPVQRSEPEPVLANEGI